MYKLNSIQCRGRYAWNESNGRESAQKDRLQDRDEDEEVKERGVEDEQQGGCGSCINMTTFCQRFLPGTGNLAIKQFAQIVAMILYQLLSQRKSPGPNRSYAAYAQPLLCVINFWHLKKAFTKACSHLYALSGPYIFSHARMLFSTGHSHILPRNAEEMKSLSLSLSH